MPALISDKNNTASNSYATVSRADEIIDTIYLSEDWFSLSEENKARLLIMASGDIDALPYLEGFEKADESQQLFFPLTDETNDGWEEAGLATVMQAWYLFNNIEGIREARSGSIQNIINEKLGSVSTTRASSCFNSLKQVSSRVFYVLQDFVDLSFRLRRG